MAIPIALLGLAGLVGIGLALAGGDKGPELDAGMPDDLKKKVADMLAHELQPTVLEAEAASPEIASALRGGPFQKAQTALRQRANILFQTPKVGPFDPGMSPEIAQAVATALSRENDPARLRAFASTLRPEFPRAAGLLEMKANQLDAMNQHLPAPLPLPVPPSMPLPLPPPVVPAVLVTPQGPVPAIPGINVPFPVVPQAPPPGVPPVFPQVGSHAFVTTQTDPLNLRGGPSTSAPVVGSLPKGSTVTLIGPLNAGFYQVVSDMNGARGFASAQFLGLVPGMPSMPSMPSIPLVPGGPFPSPGSLARVTTANDPLNLRGGPSTSAPVVGSLPRGSTATITGPLIAGFYPVLAASGAGFASAQFLGPAGTIPDLVAVPLPPPAPPLFDPASLDVTLAPPFPMPGSTARVTTATDPLNLRASAPSGAVIGTLPKGSAVVISGPLSSGFYHVTAPSGQTGFASAQFLGPAGTMTAGIAGPSAPASRDELHQTALALDTALKTQTCRAYNEPAVRRFQAAAKRAGIYTGQIDGWYGTKAQAALGVIVGNPAPPCFPEPSGGPVNPNSYWAPAPIAA